MESSTEKTDFKYFINPPHVLLYNNIIIIIIMSGLQSMLLHWFMFVVHGIKQQEVSKILLIHVLAARKKPHMVGNKGKVSEYHLTSINGLETKIGMPFMLIRTICIRCSHSKIHSH